MLQFRKNAARFGTLD